ncbi:hypothetical protein [Arthrobacter sp. 35W]|uniref:hypothetical protein n=1 Tax=Arthrobacter sp. 35W TaxID=1132441 RepID=UPI0003F754F3|nr:hypothetical protein [Arthrobacter sp. 35W]
MDIRPASNPPASVQLHAGAPSPGPQPLTWDGLHAAIVEALHHLDRGAPLYIAADVLTEDLYPRLRT